MEGLDSKSDRAAYPEGLGFGVADGPRLADGDGDPDGEPDGDADGDPDGEPDGDGVALAVGTAATAWLTSARA